MSDISWFQQPTRTRRESYRQGSSHTNPSILKSFPSYNNSYPERRPSILKSFPSYNDTPLERTLSRSSSSQDFSPQVFYQVHPAQVHVQMRQQRLVFEHFSVKSDFRNIELYFWINLFKFINALQYDILHLVLSIVLCIFGHYKMCPIKINLTKILCFCFYIFAG